MRQFKVILLVWLSVVSLGFAAEKFSVAVRIDKQAVPIEITIDFKIANGAYIYADSVAVFNGTNKFSGLWLPKPVKKYDPFSDSERDVYTQDYSAKLRLVEKTVPQNLTIEYQGCDEKLCFPPRSVSLDLSPSVNIPSTRNKISVDMSDRELSELLSRYNIAGAYSGYLSADELLSFLDDADTGHSSGKVDVASIVAQKGMLAAILIIIVFGLGLNLTPCVLPMIPVNLAIIGAGVASSSKSRGFMLGLAYGAGMAMFYGVLGVFIITTGATFGVLNSSPLFNTIIAVVFAVMALGMFDVIVIDASRFQGRFGAAGRNRGFGMAFVAGGVAALLAGACVAPVIISVLIFSVDLYAKGNIIAFALPFLLGIGMALPWPLAGAGLSFLPKPGAWMTKIKYLFGVIISIAALYYGKLAYEGFKDVTASSADKIQAAKHDASHVGWTDDIKTGLRAGLAENKPVFIDLWASWCKSCMKMEKTTFRDPRAVERLQGYVRVKFQAERPAELATKEVMDHFQALGLPTFVVLIPDRKQ